MGDVRDTVTQLIKAKSGKTPIPDSPPLEIYRMALGPKRKLWHTQQGPPTRTTPAEQSGEDPNSDGCKQQGEGTGEVVGQSG